MIPMGKGWLWALAPYRPALLAEKSGICPSLGNKGGGRWPWKHSQGNPQVARPCPSSAEALSLFLSLLSTPARPSRGLDGPSGLQDTPPNP